MPVTPLMEVSVEGEAVGGGASCESVEKVIGSNPFDNYENIKNRLHYSKVP